MKLRHMEIVTDKDKLSVDIQQTVMKYKTIKQWAYISRDKEFSLIGSSVKENKWQRFFDTLQAFC